MRAYADNDEIVRAVQAVASGEAIFGPGIATRLMAYFASPPVNTLGSASFPELTARERKVLELIARGLPNGEISTRLGLSAETVRNDISNIFTKLQVLDRAQAIVKARDAGLGRRES
jgi:DNA-binding NarL/FixJ family response regulator